MKDCVKMNKKLIVASCVEKEVPYDEKLCMKQGLKIEDLTKDVSSLRNLLKEYRNRKARYAHCKLIMDIAKEVGKRATKQMKWNISELIPIALQAKGGVKRMIEKVESTNVEIKKKMRKRPGEGVKKSV